MTRVLIVAGAGLLAATLCALLIVAVFALPLPENPMPKVVHAQLPGSGVSHPVTAVLLNFRAYDTLLELAVLLLAALAVRALPPEPVATPVSPPALLVVFARRLMPVLILVAGYLLWRGSAAPGGAFHAGALAAAGAVLAALAGAPFSFRSQWMAPLLGLGIAVFASVGASSLALGGPFLQYPPSAAGALILAIEAAITVSIAVTLALLFDPELVR